MMGNSNGPISDKRVLTFDQFPLVLKPARKPIVTLRSISIERCPEILPGIYQDKKVLNVKVKFWDKV